MASSDLERTLGELSGQLSRLAPALERVEARQNEMERNLSAMQERLRQHGEQIADAMKRMREGDKSFEAARLLEADLHSRLTIVEGRADVKRNRAWEVAQAILAALLALAVAFAAQALWGK